MAKYPKCELGCPNIQAAARERGAADVAQKAQAYARDVRALAKRQAAAAEADWAAQAARLEALLGR